jgi:cyclopropane-fatty-acyl-phospholipid synthase
MSMIRTMLGKVIEVGRLTVIKPNGIRMSFGEVPVGEPRLDVIVWIGDSLTLLKLGLDPELHFGEAFMDGTLTIEQGTLWDLMEILGRNLSRYRHRTSHGLGALARRALRRLRQYNPPGSVAA